LKNNFFVSRETQNTLEIKYFNVSRETTYTGIPLSISHKISERIPKDKNARII
jgi:hypothetical protein